MFLSEWHAFHLASCLAGTKINENSCLNVFEIVRIPDTLPLFLHPGGSKDLSATRVYT